MDAAVLTKRLYHRLAKCLALYLAFLLSGCQLSRTVNVIESQPSQGTVTVRGSVGRPGSIPIGKVAALSHVLDQAGGLVSFAPAAAPPKPEPVESEDQDASGGGGQATGNSIGADSSSDGEEDSVDEDSEASPQAVAPAIGGAAPTSSSQSSAESVDHALFPVYPAKNYPDPLLVGIQRHRQTDIYYFSELLLASSSDLVGAIHIFPGDIIHVRRASETGLNEVVLKRAGVPSMTDVATAGEYFYGVNGEVIQSKEETFAAPFRKNSSAQVLWLVRHPPGRAVREHFIHSLRSDDGLAPWLTAKEIIQLNDQLNFTGLEAVPVIASHLIATPAVTDFSVDTSKCTTKTTVTSHDVIVDWAKIHRLKPGWLSHKPTRTVTRQIEVEPEALEIDSQLRRLQELQSAGSYCAPQTCSPQDSLYQQQ